MATLNDPNPTDDLLRGALQEADGTYQENKRKAQDKSGRGVSVSAPREVTLHGALQEIEDTRAEDKRRQAELAGMTGWQRFMSRFRR